MSINGVVYRGDDPQYIQQLELEINKMKRDIALILSQQAYLKGASS